MAKLQSRLNRVSPLQEKSAWKSSGTCFPGCRDSREILISHLNRGSGLSLACSPSLNYLNLAGEEDNAERGAPSTLHSSVHLGQSF